MADIEFYSDRGCSQRISTSVPISSGHERTERYSPMSAFDGEHSTLWGGRKNEQGEMWIGAELDEKASVLCIRFRQTADPPEPQARWSSNEGNCGVDGRGCGTSPGHPGQHGNSEECELSAPAGEPIVVLSFATESGFDFLTVNNRIYEGQQGPEGIIPTGRVHWDTDGSVVTSGWRLCARKGWAQTVSNDAALRVDKYDDRTWSEMPWTIQGSLSDGWTTVLINGPDGQTGDYPASEGCPIGMMPAAISVSESCAALVRPTAAPFVGRSNSLSVERKPGATVAVLLMLFVLRNFC